jgi:hypothetical protein
VDWFSRRVLSWRLSITLETDFCVEALKEALRRFWTPEIFNTDQGSQFTSIAFTSVLVREKIAISMDGKGAWRDNVIVERLWRSVKYEEVVCCERDRLFFLNGQGALSEMKVWKRRSPSSEAPGRSTAGTAQPGHFMMEECSHDRRSMPATRCRKRLPLFRPAGAFDSCDRCVAGESIIHIEAPAWSRASVGAQAF